MKVLVINCGSSSIKYQLFRMPAESILKKGLLEKIGQRGSRIKDHYQGIKEILQKLDVRDLELIGHRVVHGGEEFKRPTLINDRVIRKIKQYARIAPLHNPPGLTGILACKRLLPGLAQVAVFDTAFHQTLPARAYLYGLPYRFYKKYGIRKYGFHGTSHAYVAAQAAKAIGRPLKSLNLITCHLGNGCSIAAIKRGRSIDTSMGFTPLEGLIMGTRCGDLDPAILLFLMQKERLTAKRLDDILNRESGLRGISGVSNDVRKIKKAAQGGNARARLALDIFIYRLRKYIASYSAVLGKVNAVIFTAGIGENNPDIIKEACRGIIDRSKTRILVIPTDEELMIARASYALISKRK
jgi:acetate kinase